MWKDIKDFSSGDFYEQYKLLEDELRKPIDLLMVSLEEPLGKMMNGDIWLEFLQNMNFFIFMHLLRGSYEEAIGPV